MTLNLHFMPFSQIHIIPFFSFNIKVRVNLKCKEYSFEALIYFQYIRH